MPTLSPYIAAPQDEDDDEGFSSGVTKDLQNMATASPSAQGGPPPAPAAASPPAPAPAPSGDDSFANIKVPVYVPPDRQALNDAYTKLGTDQQVTPHDQATAPKWWERVLGGVAGFAGGFAHDPGAGDAAAAITNRRYNQAEQARLGRVAADQTDLAKQQAVVNGSDHDFERNVQGVNTQVLMDQRNERIKDMAAEQQQRESAIAPGSEAPDDPNNPLGTWHATSQSGKPLKLATPPDKWLDSPQGKQLIENKRREDLITAGGLKGDDAKFIRVNGKLRDAAPQRATEGEIAMGQARQAFVNEHGRAPKTLAEFASVRAAAAGRNSSGGSDDDNDDSAHTSAIVADSVQKKQQFADAYTQQPNGSYENNTDGKTLSATEFGDKIDSYRLDANKRLARYGAQMDATGQVVSTRSKAPPTASRSAVAPATSAQPAAPQQPALKAVPKVGDVVKGYKYLGGDPSQKSSWGK